MNMMTTLGMRRCDARLEALRTEFGGMMAARIVEAEAADFLWESRVRERYLGQRIEAIGEDGVDGGEISRIAFLSDFDGGWHTGICLVDGEGEAVGLLWHSRFDRFFEARMLFDGAR